MNNLKEQNIEDFICNPFFKIGKEWMLITAGTKEKINTMTASWGSLGVMWGKNVAFTFIRPQRYTKEFIDDNNTFSLCFFPEEYKKHGACRSYRNRICYGLRHKYCCCLILHHHRQNKN